MFDLDGMVKGQIWPNKKIRSIWFPIGWFSIPSLWDQWQVSFKAFKMINPYWILKEESKVKYDFIKRYAAHDFLQVGLTFQTCRSNNKWFLDPLKMVNSCLTLKEGSRGQIWSNEKIHSTWYSIGWFNILSLWGQKQVSFRPFKDGWPPFDIEAGMKSQICPHPKHMLSYRLV